MHNAPQVKEIELKLNIGCLARSKIQFGNTPTLLSSGELLRNEKHSCPINNFKLEKKKKKQRPA